MNRAVIRVLVIDIRKLLHLQDWLIAICLLTPSNCDCDNQPNANKLFDFSSMHKIWYESHVKVGLNKERNNDNTSSRSLKTTNIRPFADIISLNTVTKSFLHLQIDIKGQLGYSVSVSGDSIINWVTLVIWFSNPHFMCTTLWKMTNISKYS